jgi:hypothetical protein
LGTFKKGKLSSACKEKDRKLPIYVELSQEMPKESWKQLAKGSKNRLDMPHQCVC